MKLVTGKEEFGQSNKLAEESNVIEKLGSTS